MELRAEAGGVVSVWTSVGSVVTSGGLVAGAGDAQGGSDWEEEAGLDPLYPHLTATLLRSEL